MQKQCASRGFGVTLKDILKHSGVGDLKTCITECKLYILSSSVQKSFENIMCFEYSWTGKDENYSDFQVLRLEEPRPRAPRGVRGGILKGGDFDSLFFLMYGVLLNLWKKRTFDENPSLNDINGLGPVRYIFLKLRPPKVGGEGLVTRFQKHSLIISMG